MRSIKTILLAVTIFSFVIFSAPVSDDAGNISMEEFYKVRSYFGKSARNIKFSEDDRYLAFLWNPYNEFGYDLYVYDTLQKKMIRVTSIENMKQFDTPEDHERFIKKAKKRRAEEEKQLKLYYAQRDYLLGKSVDLSVFEKQEIEKLKKELKEEELKKEKEKKEKKTEKIRKKKGKKEEKKKELELWELRDKLKKKKEDEKVKRGDLYPGVSKFEWSKSGSDMIFQYRGDLFRYFPESGKIVRLTMTDGSERLVSYDKKGEGFFYLKSNELFYVRFNSSAVIQLNHRLEKDKDTDKNRFKIEDTVVSPDGKWMFIVSSKRKGKGGYKDVYVMNYKERFAKPEKIKRQMTDTKRNLPKYRFYLRKVNLKNWGKQPAEIFSVPGGDIWYELSDIKWSKNSKYYAFMTWEREKGDLKIWFGTPAEGKKPELLFSMKEEIGYKSNYYNNLRFSPDGKNLAAILFNRDGFRQPFLFNLNTKKRTELVKGKFESFPILGFSSDSKTMYLLSDKQDTAYLGLYGLNLETKVMTRLGLKNGVHDSTAVSHNGKMIASMFGNWKNPKELFLFNTLQKDMKKLTVSHNPEWKKINFIDPELFTYKNRHGDTIHGIVFKPNGWKATDKRAGIVYLYGGPLGRSHTIMTGRISSLSYMFQMVMAAKHGFVTINIDPRGQSGYGKRFNEANFKNPGKSQTEDLEDLVKEINKGRFGIDSSRLGLHGWSFGGFQTLYTMLSSPDTFSCGISAAPPTQWENYNSWYTGATIGDSKRGKMNIRKYSLLPLAKNLKKPLLMVHGMMDKNVLYQDTVNMYRAFLEAGKETLVDLFLDPDGSHGLRGVIQNKGTFKKFESWFVKHLKK